MEVFLSSTKEDLEDFREATYASLKDHHRVTRMEDFPSGGLPPLDFCLSLVEAAEIVILLIGYRYGGRTQETGTSYTEAEYERAQEKEIPVLAYVRDDFEVGLELEDQSPADKESLRAFREQVESEKVVRRPFFRTPSDLAEKVPFDLAFWQNHATVRPTFGRRSGLIRDEHRYARETSRRSALRGLPFPVTLVNLATMDLDRYPDDRGGRLVNKLISIEDGLRSKDIQASIFNNLGILESKDVPVLEQRLRFIHRKSSLIVCFSKTSQDLPRLKDFDEVESKVVVWHPAGTTLPANFSPLYAQAYTPDDLQKCLLRVEAEQHIFELATQELFKELAQ